jgi:primase-polymerase (primpol)-like protein
MIICDYNTVKPFADPYFFGLKQWTGVKIVPSANGGKPDKVPYTCKGYKAKSSDNATWDSFDNCVTAWNSGAFATELGQGYLGLAMVQSSKLACLDFDKITDAAKAKKIIDFFASYTTLSASGNGRHVWGIVDIDFPYTQAKMTGFDFELFTGLNSMNGGGRVITETFKVAGHLRLRNITQELFFWIEKVNKFNEVKKKVDLATKQAASPSKPWTLPSGYKGKKGTASDMMSDVAFERSVASHAKNIATAAAGNSHSTMRASVLVWVEDYKAGRITGTQLQKAHDVLRDAAVSRKGDDKEFSACWLSTLG